MLLPDVTTPLNQGLKSGLVRLLFIILICVVQSYGCCVPDWASIVQLEEVKMAMDWMGAKSKNCMTEAKQSSPEPNLETVQCHI